MDEQTRLQQRLTGLTDRLEQLLAISTELSRRHKEVLTEADRLVERLDRTAEQLRALIELH